MSGELVYLCWSLIYHWEPFTSSHNVWKLIRVFKSLWSNWLKTVFNDIAGKLWLIYHLIWHQCSECCRKIREITGKQGFQLYLKRCSGTGVILWILQNFQDHLFYRASPMAGSAFSWRLPDCCLTWYFHSINYAWKLMSIHYLLSNGFDYKIWSFDGCCRQDYAWEPRFF